MSKIALTPDVDGTGTLSIVSPNTNTNRTLTLPDESGSVLTSGAALPAISGAALTSLTSANLSGALPAIDGAALTNLTSANLTGALPAIDGSALTGVGTSTAFAAVGTYTIGRPNNTTQYSQGDTASSMYSFGTNRGQVEKYGGGGYSQTAVAGTWRSMNSTGVTYGDGWQGLWVRIA
tara:strand:- start:60 stop:593 length:534 start_codon:yes stop_codon:yes gene_type:complete